MRRVEVDGHAARLDQIDESIDDLLAESLLHRDPSREEPDDPRQLRDPDDPLAGHVADMRDPEEGQRMVLAESVDGDRALDDLVETGVRAAPAFRRKEP